MAKVLKKTVSNPEAENLYYPENKAGSGLGTTKTSSEKTGLNEDMLEQYGVWIKVEPEVISDADIPLDTANKSSKKAEFFDLDALPEEVSQQSGTEEDISFEDIRVPHEEDIYDSFGSVPEEEPLSPEDANVDLDKELEAFEEELPAGNLPDIDETGISETEVVGEGVNEDIGIEEPINLASSEIELEEEPGTEGMEGIELLEEGEGREIEDLADVDLENLPDIDVGEALGEIDDSEIPELGNDEAPGELELEENIEAAGTEDENLIYGQKDEYALDEDIENFKPEDFSGNQDEVEVSLSSDQHFVGRLDDLETAGVGAEEIGGAEKSSILSKIEKELLAIKSELAEIKSELAVVRAPYESAPPKTKSQNSQEAAGFFDEEEDETIALTGDELNNILNNADITEEAADEFGAGEDESEQTAPSLKHQKVKVTEPAEAKPKQTKSDEPRYESTPIDKIELEETPLENEEISADQFETSPVDEVVPEIKELEEVDIDLEAGDTTPADISSSIQDDLESGKPGIPYSDGIPLEEEIEFGAEDEEAKSQVPVSDETNFEELLGKDLEEAEEIELSPQLEGESGFEEISPIELGSEPTSSKEEQPEIIEGIDFDLPEEDNIIVEESLESAPSEDTTALTDELDNVIDVGKITGAPEEDVSEMEELGSDEVFEEVLPEENETENAAVSESLDEESSLVELAEEPGNREIDELASSAPFEEEALEVEELAPELEAEGGLELEKGAGDSLEIEEMLPEEDIELVADEDLSTSLESPEMQSETTLPSETEQDVVLESIGAEEPVQAAKQEQKYAENGAQVALLPETLKVELKSVLSYLDRLLDTLPEKKVQEFAKSDYFITYKKLFKELGLSE